MGKSHVWLTCVDFLQRDMLLQLPAEANLSAVLSTRPVISKDEVGVAAVQDWQLAERVGHCLIRPGHLKHETPCFTQVRNSTFCCQVFYYINICRHCRLRLRLVCLTSLPIRSSLFSTIPHGAIPIAQTFPLDFEEWSFRASPTWRITPGGGKKKSWYTKWLFLMSKNSNGIKSSLHKEWRLYLYWLLQWRSRLQWWQQLWSALYQRPASAWEAGQSSGGLHEQRWVVWEAPAASPSPSGGAGNLVWSQRRPWCTAGGGRGVSARTLQKQWSWRVTPQAHYHGLVDMSSSLKLQHPVGISGGDVGVFEGTPSLRRLDFQLDQWGPVLFGPQRDGGVLCHQLTTAAPEQKQQYKQVTGTDVHLPPHCVR